MGIPALDVTVVAAVPIVPARYRREAMVNPLDLVHELGLTKSALLYADHVSLASWRVSMVQAWAEIRVAERAGDAAQVLRLLAAVEWARAGAGSQDASSAVSTLRQVPPEDLTLDVIQAHLGNRLRELDLLLDFSLETPSWRDLQAAINAGLVEVVRMGTRTEFGFSREAAIVEYMSLLGEITQPVSQTVPMLDYSGAGVLEVGSNVGVLTRPLPGTSTELALAGHYVGSLPTFAGAPMASVLRAREELKRPLIRFRALMVDLSREIGVSPVAPEFDVAANEMFRQEVAPELDAIIELSRDRGLWRLLGDEIAGSQGGTIAKAVIGLAAANVAALPAVAQAAIGGAVVAADVASAAYKRRRALDAQRMGNRLLWLYELERKLGSSSAAPANDDV